MARWLVEVVCDDGDLLSFLTEIQQLAGHTFTWKEDKTYLSSPTIDIFDSPEEVETYIDEKLLYLNGLLKYHFKIGEYLKRSDVIIDMTDGNRAIGHRKLSISTRVRVREGFNEMALKNDFNTLNEIITKSANKTSRAIFCYYAQPVSWFALFKIFEEIKNDAEKERWIFLSLEEERVNQFKYTANNFYGSGLNARHSESEYPKPSLKLSPMSLQDGQNYIDQLISEWLLHKRK
jgi:hypothetical protein